MARGAGRSGGVEGVQTRGAGAREGGGEAGVGNEGDCGRARSALCRLAAGDGIGEAGPFLARHARKCGACRRFADTLAGVRGWLEGAARAGAAPRRGSPAGAGSHRGRRACRARVALARELSARLARDLVALCEGRTPRSLACRRRDVDRLRRLGRHPSTEAGPAGAWMAAVPLLLEQARPRNRAACLELARAMDPCGLDLALAHLGLLVRRGESRTADEEADRLLLRIG